MNIFANARKDRDNLLQRRAAFLKEAEDCKNAGDSAGYKAKMDEAKALNTQIDELNEQVTEADRYAQNHAPKFGAGQKDLSEMGKAMAAGERVKIDVVDVFASMRKNEGTLLSSPVVTPAGGGNTIHDGFAGQISSLLNQVNVQNLSGLGSWEEPYVKADMEAAAGDVVANSGKARAVTDPVFAKAGMSAYEATVTSYVDKKLGQLSPADYAAKVQQMALRALHRKAIALMVNGDGGASPKMYGFLNAKNTTGENIFATSAATAIDVDALNKLVYGYGGDEMLGGNARLFLTKANLEAFGNLKGTNEKLPFYEIAFDAATGGNTGTIKRGGLIVPYTICSAIGAKNLAYGDPFNYMLALFSDYVIGVDNSYKAGERLATILGDVTLSGNLTVDKGMSVATLAAAAQA